MLNKLSGIYCILNTKTKKIYIGSAINLRNRIYQHKNHLKYNKHPNIHLQRAWDKYGEKSFNFSIIEICWPIDLLKREQLWINYFKSYDIDFGYNILEIAGSRLGSKHSEKTKEKLRNRIYTDEQKAFMSISQIGKQHSEETKIKISKANKGKIISDEQKLKISQAKKGKKQSLEHLAKLSIIRKGKSNFKARKLDKWPHELGSKCKCRECLDKNNKARNVQRFISEIQIMKGFQI